VSTFSLTIDTSAIPRDHRVEVVSDALEVAKETIRRFGLVEDDSTHYTVIDGSDASQPTIRMQEIEYGGRVIGSWFYTSSASSS
jgi:hypothetical protein